MRGAPPEAAAVYSGPALDRLAARFAVGFRVGATAVALVAGPLGASGEVSGVALGVALAGLTLWTGVFVALAAGGRLTARVVLADTVVVIAVLLAHRALVPDTMIDNGTSWVLVIGSSAVFITQIMLPPRAGLPLGALVTVAYVVGSPMPAFASFLVLQTVVTCVLVTLLRSGGRAADAIIADELKIRQETLVLAGRRADEREQFRRLHDTVLSTLTMVGLGVFQEPSATLTARAAQDLRTVTLLGSRPGDSEPGPGALHHRLAQVAADTELEVTLVAPPLSVPSDVADRIIGSVAEALRNVVKHAEVEAAIVRMEQRDDVVVVEIVDDGVGFDAGRLPPGRRGIRESIIARMENAGGIAEVISRSGAGTRVVLRWPHA